MSRNRFVRGKTRETVHGDINYISESDIVDMACLLIMKGKRMEIFMEVMI